MKNDQLKGRGIYSDRKKTKDRKVSWAGASKKNDINSSPIEYNNNLVLSCCCCCCCCSSANDGKMRFNRLYSQRYNWKENRNGVKKSHELIFEGKSNQIKNKLWSAVDSQNKKSMQKNGILTINKSSYSVLLISYSSNVSMWEKNCNSSTNSMPT